MKPPPGLHSAIISRIKVIGKMDIAEKRLPQEGRVRQLPGTEAIAPSNTQLLRHRGNKNTKQTNSTQNESEIS